jgi:hypothetical protein
LERAPDCNKTGDCAKGPDLQDVTVKIKLKKDSPACVPVALFQNSWEMESYSVPIQELNRSELILLFNLEGYSTYLGIKINI